VLVRTNGVPDQSSAQFAADPLPDYRLTVRLTAGRAVAVTVAINDQIIVKPDQLLSTDAPAADTVRLGAQNSIKVTIAGAPGAAVEYRVERLLGSASADATGPGTVVLALPAGPKLSLSLSGDVAGVRVSLAEQLPTAPGQGNTSAGFPVRVLVVPLTSTPSASRRATAERSKSGLTASPASTATQGYSLVLQLPVANSTPPLDHALAMRVSFASSDRSLLGSSIFPSTSSPGINPATGEATTILQSTFNSPTTFLNWDAIFYPIYQPTACPNNYSLVEVPNTNIGSTPNELFLIPGIQLDKPECADYDDWNPATDTFGTLVPNLGPTAGAPYDANADYLIHVLKYPTYLGVTEAARYLDSQIERHPPGPGGKVVIVAHSLGGLVARKYMELFGAKNRVSKIITLGTPHYGTPDADLNWNASNRDPAWNPLKPAVLNCIGPHNILLLNYVAGLVSDANFRPAREDALVTTAQPDAAYQGKFVTLAGVSTIDNITSENASNIFTAEGMLLTMRMLACMLENPGTGVPPVFAHDGFIPYSSAHPDWAAATAPPQFTNTDHLHLTTSTDVIAKVKEILAGLASLTQAAPNGGLRPVAGQTVGNAICIPASEFTPSGWASGDAWAGDIIKGTPQGLLVLGSRGPNAPTCERGAFDLSPSNIGLSFINGDQIFLKIWKTQPPGTVDTVVAAWTWNNGPVAQPAPTRFNLSASATLPTQVDLAWAAPNVSADRFAIERADSGSTSFAFIASVGPNVLGYRDVNVRPTTSYVYRVSAFAGTNAVQFSNAAAVLTPAGSGVRQVTGLTIGGGVCIPLSELPTGVPGARWDTELSKGALAPRGEQIEGSFGIEVACENGVFPLSNTFPFPFGTGDKILVKVWQEVPTGSDTVYAVWNWDNGPVPERPPSAFTPSSTAPPMSKRVPSSKAPRSP